MAQNSEVKSELKEFLSCFSHTPDELKFNIQGLWGYTSFEAVEYMEEISLPYQRDELKDNPDLKYQLFEFILVFDHFKNELYIVHNSINKPCVDYSKIDYILQLIQVNNLPNFSFETIGAETSNYTDDEFRQMITRGVHHCKIGDTFQLVLSRQFSQKFKGDDFNLYRCLRSVNPSPYLFYFDYGNYKIFGSSPEAQLQVKDGIASINPIAGTVLRGQNQKEDATLAQELKSNPKEISEHVMLVDLARNDLSKRSTSVKVEQYAETQFFSHVIHMVSNVTGVLDENEIGIDVYTDTFPAGTLSGAPKYKALEIIGNMENTSRNFYGGSIGFLGFDGSVNQAIIIRSVLSKNNTIIYQAGAGVVSDSTPEGELQEVNNKVAAIRKSIKTAIEL